MMFQSEHWMSCSFFSFWRRRIQAHTQIGGLHLWYVSIFDCCFYHAITAIEYAEDIPLINYQNLTCCARCKIKKLHLENNELQRQLFNNTALNLKYDRFSKCKKKKGRFYISVLFNVLLNVFLRLVLFNVFFGGGVGGWIYWI